MIDLDKNVVFLDTWCWRIMRSSNPRTICEALEAARPGARAAFQQYLDGKWTFVDECAVVTLSTADRPVW